MPPHRDESCAAPPARQPCQDGRPASDTFLSIRTVQSEASFQDLSAT